MFKIQDMDERVAGQLKRAEVANQGTTKAGA
jgi:hypothetical protein